MSVSLVMLVIRVIWLLALSALSAVRAQSQEGVNAMQIKEMLLSFQKGMKKDGNGFKERPGSKFYGHKVAGVPAPVPTSHFHGPDWGYGPKNGPSTWGGHCQGTNQSPIDIATSPRPTVTTKTSQYVFLDYKQGKGLGITNNGRAIVGEGDALLEHKLTFDSYDYFLKRFVFHKPSEHTIDGKRFELEAQLEHVAKNGKRVILAVLFDKGQENKFLNQLNWKHLPDSPMEGGNGISTDMKMNDLIPGYSEHNFFRYYMYMGSMTTPPCQNWGVRWVVVKQAAQISTEQLSKFPFLNNSRPLQDAGQRTIYENAARTPAPTAPPTTPIPTAEPTHPPTLFDTLAFSKSPTIA